jgi:hypothetical protein
LLALLIASGGTGCGWWVGKPVFAIVAVFQAATILLALEIFSRLQLNFLTRLSYWVGLLKPVTATVTATADRFRLVSRYQTIDDSWSRFSGFSEEEDMIILWYHGTYIPLPKEFSASEAVWMSLRDLIQLRLRKL